MATRIAVLNAGHLEQIGTPAEVYDRPASAFVAGFLGSPAMNLLPATVSAVDGQIRLDADGIRGTMWAGETEAFPVMLGVRPEHWQVEWAGAATDALARPEASGLIATGVIDAVENLGSEEIVYCTIGAHRTAVRMLRTDTLVAGQQVRLHAKAEHVHLFDRDSGRRLEWVADTDADADADTDTDADAAVAGVVTVASAPRTPPRDSALTPA